MEDFERMAVKYAKILTDLKETIHCLESEEEQQEEKKDEQNESSDSQSTSQYSEEDSHETEEEENFATRSDHFSVWMPTRGPYRCHIFTRTDDESQTMTDVTPRPQPMEEEQKVITQASLSQTMTRKLYNYEDGISEAGGSASHEAASNEDHDYNEIFEAMITIPADFS